MAVISPRLKEPGGRRAGRRAKALGLASWPNRSLFDLVLQRADLSPYFRAVLSSEEVPKGKPAPEVYVQTAPPTGVDARLCAAVEDSTTEHNLRRPPVCASSPSRISPFSGGGIAGRERCQISSLDELVPNWSIPTDRATTDCGH